MTHTFHKILVTAASIATAIGAYIVGAETVPFDLDAQDVGLALIWSGTIVNIVATAVRANWIPGIATGIANDGQ